MGGVVIAKTKVLWHHFYAAQAHHSNEGCRSDGYLMLAVWLFVRLGGARVLNMAVLLSWLIKWRHWLANRLSSLGTPAKQVQKQVPSVKHYQLMENQIELRRAEANTVGTCGKEGKATTSCKHGTWHECIKNFKYLKSSNEYKTQMKLKWSHKRLVKITTTHQQVEE